MKKRIFIIMAVLLLVVTGCGTNEPKKETTYHELTLDQFNKKIENKERFVIVLGAASCSACATYKVAMEKVIKDHNLVIYYLDGDKLDIEGQASVKSKVNYVSTPTTVFFNEEGVAASTHERLVGAAEYSTIIEYLTKHNFIGK